MRVSTHDGDVLLTVYGIASTKRSYAFEDTVSNGRIAARSVDVEIDKSIGRVSVTTDNERTRVNALTKSGSDLLSYSITPVDDQYADTMTGLGHKYMKLISTTGLSER